MIKLKRIIKQKEAIFRSCIGSCYSIKHVSIRIQLPVRNKERLKKKKRIINIFYTVSTRTVSFVERLVFRVLFKKTDTLKRNAKRRIVRSLRFTNWRAVPYPSPINFTTRYVRATPRNLSFLGWKVACWLPSDY